MSVKKVNIVFFGSLRWKLRTVRHIKCSLLFPVAPRYISAVEFFKGNKDVTDGFS